MTDDALRLDNFLRKMNSNPNVAFAVRQRNPFNIDEAVVAALELETYLTAIAPTAISSVETQVADPGAVATVKMDPLEKILDSL